MGRINCFIPFANAAQVGQTVENLKNNELVNKIYLLANAEAEGSVEDARLLM